MENFKNTNETYSYWRNPTKEEIKFGCSAIHFRDFKKENCYNDNGTFRLAFILKCDKRKYQSCNYEWSVTRKYKATVIDIIE